MFCSLMILSSQNGVVFFPHLGATLLDFPFYCGVRLVQTDISTSINYKFNQWLGCQHCKSVGMNSTLTLILSNYLQPFFMFYAINLYVVSLFEEPFFMFFSLRIHYVLYQFNWMNIISFSKKKLAYNNKYFLLLLVIFHSYLNTLLFALRQTLSIK